ncbi:MAG: Stp1/IreP family PP2C-type Ser/Thr phosphatase [Elusimicrobia bacterium]|nr:Stp1/IreP family PP2C-type Ser/Thr phosphatase [Elusimicrobiota bacterium]
MNRTRLEIAAKTDPGCVRTNNEDNLAVVEDLGLLVVCDGMGGHSSGEVASQIAADTVKEFALKMMGGPTQLVPEGGDASRSARARQLEYFVKTANTMIFEKARAFPKDHGMGTTIVAALVDERSMTVAHVGDSRLYVLRNGALQQMTEDHSLVMDQVRRGLITLAEAEKSTIQNILTRALGTEAEVVVDVQDHPLLAGDLLMLCSDGLTKHVAEADLARTLREGKSANELCDALIQKARDGGGSDNITVVVARVPGARSDGLLGRLSNIFHT